MAQGDPYARILEIMKRQGKAYNGYDMVPAKIASIDPISIIVNGQVIDSHIFYHGLLTSNRDEELALILAAEKYISVELKQFLIDLYKELRVQPGDRILVQRVKNSFYICGKVGTNE